MTEMATMIKKPELKKMTKMSLLTKLASSGYRFRCLIAYSSVEEAVALAPKTPFCFPLQDLAKLK